MAQDITPEQSAAEKSLGQWTPGMRVAGMLGWLIDRYEHGLTGAEARELLRGVEELAHELKEDPPAIAFVRDPSADAGHANAWTWRVCLAGQGIGLLRIDTAIINRLNEAEIEVMLLRQAADFLAGSADARFSRLERGEEQP